MLEALPTRALFRFEVEIPYWAEVPSPELAGAGWTQDCLAPPLYELEEQDYLADVYWAWNHDGLHMLFEVDTASRRPKCDLKQWWKFDGLRVCIDTRDVRDAKRATRFCHFFYLLPTGGGRDGKQVVIGQHRMSRSKEPPPSVDLSRVVAHAEVRDYRYSLAVFFPGTALNGWDPAEHSRIGIFYKVKDHLAGGQTLSAADEMGWNADPSTWATGVLTPTNGAT